MKIDKILTAERKLVVLFFCVFLMAITLPGNCKELLLPSIFQGAFSIGGQFYDYQNYHQIPYFHGGMDLRAPAGTEVYTPVTGIIEISAYQIKASAEPPRFSYERRAFSKNEKSKTRYLEVAITDDEGKKWMFRHITPASVPDSLFDLATTGGSIKAGSLIGTVAEWPVPVLPERDKYCHVHLEIIASAGGYLNPADFVTSPKDYYPPVIHGIFFVKHRQNHAFSGYPHPVVSGKVDLVAMLNDRMNHSAYQHSVYKAAYKLEKLGEKNEKQTIIAETTAYKFDRLPFIGERHQLAKIIYRDSIVYMGRKLQANGSDGPRIFLLNLSAGNVKRGYDSFNCLDTRGLENGFYRLTVKAFDRAGNDKTSFQDFVIKN
jgi:hypothetical protein